MGASLLVVVMLMTSCHDGRCADDYTVINNEDLNALSGCVEIEGSLVIASGPDVVSLDALQELESVTGRLAFQRTSLTSLDGLENLIEVNGPIDVYNNDELLSWGAFPSLQRTGDIALEGNFRLTEIVGPPSLEAAGSIRVQGNDVLWSVSGFNGLQSMDGELILEGSPYGVFTVDGFETLENTEGAIRIIPGDERFVGPITGFNSLRSLGQSPDSELELVATTLEGFSAIPPDWPHSLSMSWQVNNAIEQLTTVAGDLTLAHRGGDYGFVETLTDVGGDLRIENGPNTLDGFVSLRSVRNLVIRGTGIIDVGQWPSLESAQEVMIEVNDDMDEVTGFNALSVVDRIRFDAIAPMTGASLQRISGFNGLVQARHELTFHRLWSLTTIDGFQSLGTVADESLEDVGTVELTELKAIQDISGLANLQTIGHALRVHKTELTALHPWPGLTVLGELSVMDNLELTALGLTGLQEIKTSVTIAGNWDLPCSDAQSLANAAVLHDGVEVVISGNAGCPGDP